MNPCQPKEFRLLIFQVLLFLWRNIAAPPTVLQLLCLPSFSHSQPTLCSICSSGNEFDNLIPRIKPKLWDVLSAVQRTVNADPAGLDMLIVSLLLNISYTLWWLIFCVNLAWLWHPVVWSNTNLNAAVKGRLWVKQMTLHHGGEPYLITWRP